MGKQSKKGKQSNKVKKHQYFQNKKWIVATKMSK
jgi:hypothetical protein